MNNKVTTQTYKVQYCDCDKDGLLKTSRLCELFEGLAMDALDLGCLGDLRTVMMRYRIVFDAPICGRDVINLKTYLVRSTKYVSVRRFEVTGASSGDMLVRAAATWTFMSLSKQRVAQIPPATAAYVVTSFEPFSEGEKLEDVAQGTDVDVQLREDDLDHNGHVNNAKYFSYVALGIPEAVRSGKRLTEITVDYKIAVKPGARLRLTTALEDADARLTASQKLSDGEKTCALIQSVWEAL